MRKIIAAAVVGLIALSGQAIAKETAKAASAPVAARVNATSANSNQLIGDLGLVPTILIAAAGVTLIAFIVDANNDDDKGVSP